MGRTLVITDQGTLVLKEAKANGAHGVALRAPASLAADLTWTLPATLPGGTQFLTIDATGQVGLSAGSTSSLDAAYDAGGAGAGRIITADNGPVEVAGAGGLQITHTDPALLLETTGIGDYNWKIVGDQNNDLLIQRGDQDADVSDDVFETILCVAAGTRRLGINTAVPQTDLHINKAGLTAGASLRVQADTAQDASIQFYEDNSPRFEVGYDDSAGGLVIGRNTFFTPTLFVEDSTGDVGINEVTPDAKLHVTSAENLVAVFESTEAVTGVGSIALVDKDTTNNTQVRLSADGNDLQLTAGAAVLLHLDGADGRVGVGDTTPSGKLDVLNTIASQICLFVNQDSTTGVALQIDSEATNQPLIKLLPVTGNSRGDISFGTERASAPTSPGEGDLWYDSGVERLEFRVGNSITSVVASRWGPSFGAQTEDTISIGAVNAARNLKVRGEGAAADNLDTLTVTGDGPQDGDTIVITAPVETITVRHNIGNILFGDATNLVLNNVNDTAVFMWRSSDNRWIHVGGKV